MPNSEFSNIDFAFRHGNLASIESSAYKEGTFYIDTENNGLFVDIENKRIPLTNVVYGYTEAKIKSLEIPSNKIYFAKDTFNLLYFDYDVLEWKVVGGENSTSAIYAEKDALGNRIDTTYETILSAQSTAYDLYEQLGILETIVESINRFDVQVLTSMDDLPEEGQKFIIYFVPNTSDNEDESDNTDNIYAEYLWIESEGTGYYEQIGLTTVDLSNYYTKNDIDDLLDAVNNSIDGTSGELDTFKTTVENTYETKEDASSKKSDLEGSISNLSNTVSSTYETKSDASDKKTALEESISGVSGDLDDFKTEVSNTYETKEDATDKKTTLEGSINDLSDSVAETYETKADASDKKTALEESIGEVSSDLSDYKTEVSTTYETKEDAGTKKTALEGSIDDVNTALEDFKTLVVNTYQTKEAGGNTSESVTEVSGELEDFKTEVTNTYETKSDAADKKTALEESIGQVSSDLSDYQTTVSDTYATKSELGDVSDSVAAVSESLSDYAKTTQAISSLSLSGTTLTWTFVNGGTGSLDLSTVIQSGSGNTTETIDGESVMVLDYGDEDD